LVASRIAWRRLPAPLSLAFTTVKVESAKRFSRESNVSRYRYTITRFPPETSVERAVVHPVEGLVTRLCVAPRYPPRTARRRSD
jgi:hypothetical protein